MKSKTILSLIGALAGCTVGFATMPSVTLTSPSSQTIGLNTTLTLSAVASDPDGDMNEHNLDIQRPDGQWNWEGGWSTQWPFQGGVNGDGYNSSKSASFTFNEPGVWHVRSAAADGEGWSYSNTVTITVQSGNQLPTVTLSSPGNQSVTLGAALTIASQASDPDGNMTQHNLDVQRPDGQWNWEGGWSTQWPFQGGVNGNGYSSSKSASFSFNQAGVWHVRASGSDSSGAWSYSNTVTITVAGSYGYVTAPVSASYGYSGNTKTVSFSINDNGFMSSASMTYVQGQTYPGCTFNSANNLSFSVFNVSGGPGYALWCVEDRLANYMVPGADQYNTHLFGAFYMRATRNWQIRDLGLYRGGDVNTVYPYWYEIFNLIKNTNTVNWTVWTHGYTTYERQDTYTYSIPTQPL